MTHSPQKLSGTIRSAIEDLEREIRELDRLKREKRKLKRTYERALLLIKPDTGEGTQ